ncbi:MAG TPA: hypothetical protein PKK99_01370 [Bacteroidia bacterium]|nr:hypothetical protein [Bacteroidia bacterium]
MKRSIFFLISALLAGLFGVMMLLTPSRAAEGFGMNSTPETAILFRALGAMILSTGLMNFLVRNHPDNVTLKAVLLTNIITHALSIVADMWAVSDGVLAFSKAAPGQLTHLFVAIGSLIYYLKIKADYKTNT